LDWAADWRGSLQGGEDEAGRDGAARRDAETRWDIGWLMLRWEKHGENGAASVGGAVVAAADDGGDDRRARPHAAKGVGDDGRVDTEDLDASARKGSGAESEEGGTSLENIDVLLRAKEAGHELPRPVAAEHGPPSTAAAGVGEPGGWSEGEEGAPRVGGQILADAAHRHADGPRDVHKIKQLKARSLPE
jgi:hypothetical protein